MAGAPRPDDLAGALRDAGFEQVVIDEKPASREFIKDWVPGSGAEDYVVSANVTAVKPGGGRAGAADAGARVGPQMAEDAAKLAEVGTEAAARAARRAAARAKWAAEIGLEAPKPPPAAAQGCCSGGGGCGEEADEVAEAVARATSGEKVKG